MFAAIADRLVALVAANRRRALMTIVVCLAAGLAAFFYARKIHIDTNLEALLADNAPSVMALEELRARQGSTDLLNIAVKSTDPEANRQLVEDILGRVSDWPEVTDAWVDLDYTPLRDHALYYLEVDELEELRDRLKREKQRAITSKLTIGGGEVDPSAVVDDDDWDNFDDFEDDPEEEPPQDDDASKPDAAAKSVGDLLDEQRAKIEASGRVRPRDLDLIWPRENERGEIIWEDEVHKPVASDDGQVMLVRARLTEPPTDLQFASAITDRAEVLFAELDITGYAPDMLAKVGGAYATSGEAKSIIVDLGRAGWLSATLVALVLIVAFRGPQGLVAVLIPLAVAVLVTVALARVLLGELNVLTAFLFAVLLGIGVDFAVHLYTQRQVRGGAPNWTEVLRHHLRPLSASMLTTVGSFLILVLADFKGFKEFGLIAAVGVFVAFIAAIVMVPALDVLLGSPRAARGEAPEPGAPLRSHKAPGLRWGLLAAVAALGIFGAPDVEFERDMRELRAPKSEGEKGIAYQRALKSSQDTGTPVVVLADNPEQLEAAIDALRERQPTDQIPGTDRTWIRTLISLRTHMPADQDKKEPVLAEIATISEGFLAELPDLPASNSARKYGTHLEALERLSKQPPISAEALPAWAKQLFREKNGEIGRIGLLYVDLEGYNLEQVVFVTERFRETVSGTDARGASTRFILGDLTLAVEHDTGRLPPLALLVIAALIAFDLRRFGATVITFATLCLGLLLTFGVMGVWPIRINFYNLVVMPAVVGLGIDASIHLWHSRKLGALGATSKAALVSALTTAGGFSGLIIATNGGVRSIGILGVVATLCCVVVAVIALGWPRRLRRDP